MAKRSALAKQHQLRLTSSPGPSPASTRAGSPLHVRTRLRERRPESVKRHTARIATRLGVLLGADITAAFICGLLVDVAASSGGWIAEQSARAASAGYGGPIFGVALFLSLVATGSYSRHRSLNAKARLLAGSSLACGLILWRLAGGNLVVAAAVYALTSTVTWIVVLGVRTAAETFLSTVWPGTRGAAPALLITDRREASLHLESAVLA